MTLRFATNATEKDLRRQLRDPVGLVLWLFGPLLYGAVIFSMIGPTATPLPHVLVANEDDNWLSRSLVQMLASQPSERGMRVESVKPAEGRARLDRGEATALLVVPDGFATAVLREEPTTLKLVTNPAQTILPKIVETGLEVVSEGTFYAHRLVSPELQQLIESPPENTRMNDLAAARISVAFNQAIDRVDKYLFPPVIEVKTETRPGKPAVNFRAMLLPSLIFSVMLFMANSQSSDLWRERAQGTLRRTVCTPSAAVNLLVGKLVANGLLLMASAIVLLAAAPWVGIPLSALPLSIAWAGLAGVATLLAFMILQLFSPSQRAAQMLSLGVTFPLMFIGGGFFPLESMPPWMATIGRWTPNGWAQLRLQNILLGRMDGAAIAVSFALLAAVCIAMLFLCVQRLRPFARS